MSEQLERNKQTAIAFYDLMFNQGKPAEAVRRYVGRHLHPAQPRRGRRQGGVHPLLQARWRRSTRASGCT